MTKRTESRARRTVLATVVATATLWGSFGAAAHADEEPVAEPPVETGQTDDGATVAVGAPPVAPANPPVVAVGPPPVPPTSVVVAVGPPPVPPVAATPSPVAATPSPVAAIPSPAPPVATPATTVPAEPAPAPRAHAVRQAPSVNDQVADVLADVIARIEAALVLINSRI